MSRSAVTLLSTGDLNFFSSCTTPLQNLRRLGVQQPLCHRYIRERDEESTRRTGNSNFFFLSRTTPSRISTASVYESRLKGVEATCSSRSTAVLSTCLVMNSRSSL